MSRRSARNALSEQMRSMQKKLNKLKSTAAEEVIRLLVVIFLETQTLAKDKENDAAARRDTENLIERKSGGKSNERLDASSLGDASILMRKRKRTKKLEETKRSERTRRKTRI